MLIRAQLNCFWRFKWDWSFLVSYLVAIWHFKRILIWVWASRILLRFIYWMSLRERASHRVSLRLQFACNFRFVSLWVRCTQGALWRLTHLVELKYGWTGQGYTIISLKFACSRSIDLPLVRLRTTPVMLVVETARGGFGTRTHTVIEEFDRALSSWVQMRGGTLLIWGPWTSCLSRIDDTLTQIGSMLLEIIGNVLDDSISINLVISLEFAKVDQLWERCIWLMLFHFIYLSLHLNSVTVVIVDDWKVLFVSVVCGIQNIFILRNGRNWSLS